MVVFWCYFRVHIPLQFSFVSHTKIDFDSASRYVSDFVCLRVCVANLI